MTIRHAHQPPAHATTPHLPLIRLPARGQVVLAITAWELLQVETHFVGRRTLPCLEQDCPGCAEKKPRRYEAYVAGVRQADKKHLIVGLTPGAARNLLDGVPNPTQLRGHIVTITRSGTRPNGMLRLTVSEHMVDQSRLYEAPDVLAHMLHIWGLEQSHTAQDHPGSAEATRKQFEKEGSDDGPRPRPNDESDRPQSAG